MTLKEPGRTVDLYSLQTHVSPASFLTADDYASTFSGSNPTIVTHPSGSRGGATEATAGSTLPLSLHPTKGAFQALGRTTVGDKTVANYNGKMTSATKHKKLKDKTVRGIVVFARQDILSLVLFPQIDLQADLAGDEAETTVMLGAGSSDPTRPTVNVVEQEQALGYMLIPISAALLTECEEDAPDDPAMAKLHRGTEIVVTQDHCLATELDKDETYTYFLLPVGPGLAAGTAPPRGRVDGGLYGVISQGGQPSLGLIVKAFSAYTPERAKTLQELAITNKQTLGGGVPSVPAGTTLVSTYVTPVVTADSPHLEAALDGGVAACLGEKRAASQA